MSFAFTKKYIVHCKSHKRNHWKKLPVINFSISTIFKLITYLILKIKMNVFCFLHFTFNWFGMAGLWVSCELWAQFCKHLVSLKCAINQNWIRATVHRILRFQFTEEKVLFLSKWDFPSIYTKHLTLNAHNTN